MVQKKTLNLIGRILQISQLFYQPNTAQHNLQRWFFLGDQRSNKSGEFSKDSKSIFLGSARSIGFTQLRLTWPLLAQHQIDPLATYLLEISYSTKYSTVDTHNKNCQTKYLKSTNFVITICKREQKFSEAHDLRFYCNIITSKINKHASPPEKFNHSTSFTRKLISTLN